MSVGKFIILFTFTLFSFVSTVDAHENTDDLSHNVMVLYNKSVDLIQKEMFEESKEKLEEVVSIYPFFQSAEYARVLLVFVNYILGNYDATIASANDYVSFYPIGKYADYVQYMKSLAMFVRLPDFVVDLSMVKNTRQEFIELTEKFPNSKYFKSAWRKISFIDNHLAAKEKELGLYDLLQGSYISAIIRFNHILSDYSRTNYVEESLYRCIEANNALGLYEESEKYAKVLQYNFGEGVFYEEYLNKIKSSKVNNNDK